MSNVDICNGCGKANKITLWIAGAFDINKYCEICTTPKAVVPDVYFDGKSGIHYEENIAYPKGHKLEGQPIPHYDKTSKLAAMKLAKIRECGDREHGARNESHLNSSKTGRWKKGEKSYFI